MLGSALVERGLSLTRELLRANLGNLLNERILEKALQLELRHFEDSDTYDKMQNARREANSRPLSLVMQAFTIVRNVMTLSTYAVLLVALSPWSVVVLVVASIPAFIAEARLAAEGFRLYSWRAPEGRKLNYLEWILTRDNHVKEVKLFGLGPLVLGRYRTLFQKFFDEDRALAVRRMGWGLGLGVLSLAAFYGCYAFVANRAALRDDYRGRHGAVPVRVPAGAGGVPGHPVEPRLHVRGRALHEQPLRVPGHPHRRRAAAGAAARSRRRAGAATPSSCATSPSGTRARTPGRCGT